SSVSSLSLQLVCLSDILPCFFSVNAPAPTDIYTLSLHDALPIYRLEWKEGGLDGRRPPSLHRRGPSLQSARKGVRRPEETVLVRSEEHTSELQSRENLVCRLLLEKKKTRRGVDDSNARRRSRAHE